jgi:MFS family permease
VTGLLLDTTPLRTPAFRRLWIGRSISAVGGQLTFVAVVYQVWEATHSPLWSGVVALVSAVPMVVVGLWGGGLVDRGDRRRIMLVATTGQLACSVGLAVQAAAAPSLASVFVLLGVQTAFQAVGQPAARTFTPRLLPTDQVAAGLALSRLGGQAALLGGPVVAGVVLGYGGLAVCYVVDAATFVAGLYGVLGLPPMRPLGEVARRGAGGVVDGLRFVLHEPIVRGAMITDLAATGLAMPVSLFPLVNQERFGGDPRTLGLFVSAIAVGGAVASVFSGTFTRRTRPGAAMVGAAACWGGALAVFGLVRSPWLGLGMLVLAGAADTVSVVCRGTLVQLATPDELRGRISSIELIVGVSGPDLGNLRAGAVAQATTASFALVTGGLACLVALAAGVVTSRRLLTFRAQEGSAHEQTPDHDTDVDVLTT